jgi:hypothetical protein
LASTSNRPTLFYRRCYSATQEVTDLMGAGLNKDQIMTMGREVTGKLLMG